MYSFTKFNSYAMMLNMINYNKCHKIHKFKSGSLSSFSMVPLRQQTIQMKFVNVHILFCSIDFLFVPEQTTILSGDRHHIFIISVSFRYSLCCYTLLL